MLGKIIPKLFATATKEATAVPELFATSKNGIKVYESFGENGERILESFREGELFKTIRTVSSRAEQGPGFVTNTSVTNHLTDRNFNVSKSARCWSNIEIGKQSRSMTFDSNGKRYTDEIIKHQYENGEYTGFFRIIRHYLNGKYLPRKTDFYVANWRFPNGSRVNFETNHNNMFGIPQHEWAPPCSIVGKDGTVYWGNKRLLDNAV